MAANYSIKILNWKEKYFMLFFSNYLTAYSSDMRRNSETYLQ